LDLQAVRNYIETGLSGWITAADHPEGGEGRIVCIDGNTAATAPNRP
jgi:hypothetical protein